MKFLHPRYVVVGRRAYGGGMEYWSSKPVRGQEVASEWCSAMNEDAMFDGSGWYYTFIPVKMVATWIRHHETSERP